MRETMSQKLKSLRDIKTIFPSTNNNITAINHTNEGSLMLLYSRSSQTFWSQNHCKLLRITEDYTGIKTDTMLKQLLIN